MVFKNNSNISIIPANYQMNVSYHLFELAVPDREALLDYLSKKILTVEFIIVIIQSIQCIGMQKALAKGSLILVNI